MSKVTKGTNFIIIVPVTTVINASHSAFNATNETKMTSYKKTHANEFSYIIPTFVVAVAILSILVVEHSTYHPVLSYISFANFLNFVRLVCLVCPLRAILTDGLTKKEGKKSHTRKITSQKIFHGMIIGCLLMIMNVYSYVISELSTTAKKSTVFWLIPCTFLAYVPLLYVTTKAPINVYDMPCTCIFTPSTEQSCYWSKDGFKVVDGYTTQTELKEELRERNEYVTGVIDDQKRRLLANEQQSLSIPLFYTTLLLMGIDMVSFAKVWVSRW